MLICNNYGLRVGHIKKGTCVLCFPYPTYAGVFICSVYDCFSNVEERQRGVYRVYIRSFRDNDTGISDYHFTVRLHTLYDPRYMAEWCRLSYLARLASNAIYAIEETVQNMYYNM